MVRRLLTAGKRRHDSAYADNVQRDERDQDPDTDESSAGNREFDVFAFADERASRRASVKELPSLLIRALALSYRAAPRQLVLVVVLSIASAGFAGGQVLLGKEALTALAMVDRGTASVRTAIAPFLFMALLAGLSGVATVVAMQLERVLGERTQRFALREVIQVCTSVDLEAYDEHTFYDQFQRVMSGSLSRPASVAQGLISLVRGATGAVVIVVVLLTLAPWLIPLMLLIGVPLTLTNRKGSRSEFRFSVDQAPNMRKRLYMQEVLSGRGGAKEIRAFGLSDELLGRWDRLYDEYFVALGQQVRRRLRYALIGRIGATGFALSALLLLLYLVAHHQLTLASAGAAGLALMLLSARVESMAGGGAGLYESGLFLADWSRFTSTGQRHREARSSQPAPIGFSELQTTGLSFRYPNASRLALREIDLTIKKGEVVALVGENGSGKTTLAKLLADLYRPTGGSVSWDGNDLAEMDPASVRESVAVIFQDFLMYALPASENIGVGRPEAIDDLSGIIEAAEQSGAHEFISDLPYGYDNYLSKMFKGGQDLSLGQWQRIALARAFYRNAPFVILDEPTSALDAKAEARLFSSIRELLAGRTVLFVSHRFSSVRSADRILVMNDGQIVEQGDHEALMELDGLYAELFTLQASAYLEPQPS